MRKCALACLILVLALGWFETPSAWAHPLLLHADPFPQSILPTAPSLIQLWFSEDLNGSGSRIAVLNRQGMPVDQGNTFVPPTNRRELEVKLRRLPPGSYQILWTAVSAEDGHIVVGQYVFSVRIRTALPLLTGSPGSVPGQGSLDLAGLISLLAHWLELLAALTWVGSAAFSTFVFTSAGDQLSEAATRTEAMRCKRVVRVSGLVLVLASSVLLLIQMYSLAGGNWSSALSGSTLSSVLAAQYGHLWLGRQALALLAVLLTLPVIMATPVPARRERPVGTGERGSLALVPSLSFLLGFVYLYALAASGHAASAAVGTLLGSHILSAAVFLDWLHLMAAALWLGGQIYLGLVLIPVLRPAHARQNNRAFLETLDRFSPIAYASVAVLVLTGLFNAAIHIPSWHAFFDSIYGHALLVKVVLFALMMLISAFTVFTLRPALWQVHTTEDSGPSPIAIFLMGGLLGWLRVNPFLGAGLLLAVSVLFFYPVPASPGPAAPNVPPRCSASRPTTSPRALPFGGTWVRTALTLQTDALLSDPRQPNLLWAGTLDGVWLSPNGGTTWQRTGVGLRGVAILALASTPTGDMIVAGGGDGGVYASVAGCGRTLRWRPLGLHLGSNYPIFAVAVSPTGHVVLAGTVGALYRGASATKGWRWQRVEGTDNDAITSILWTTWDAHLAFASIFSHHPSVLATHDGGKTWHPERRLPSDLPSVALHALGGRQVVLSTMGKGVWERSMAGSWHDITAGLPASHAMAMAVPRGINNLLYAGTMGFGAYAKRGVAPWRRLGPGLQGGQYTVLAMILAPGPPQVLLAGTAEGLYRYVPPR